MRLHTTICPLASALGAVSLLPAETISGFCRQTGSLNVLPFTLDTDTGLMQTLPAFTIGADRAGHYAAAGLDPGNPTPVIVTGVQSTGAAPKKLVSVNLNNGDVTPSSSGFSNVSFTGQ